MTSIPVSTDASPRYARFSRRLKAVFIDWVLTIVVVFGTLMVASSTRNDKVSLVLSVAAVLVLVLYEPVLVSRTGGTIGHYLTNLRVVDDAHGGNVGFLKALARCIIKGALGWVSFVLMAATRRNQAIHDLLTRSTVQIRDAALATPGQFITERTELAAPDMPSPMRRIAAIIGYIVVVALGAHTAIGVGLWLVGLLSDRCVMTDVCSRAENLTFNVMGLTLVASMAAVAVLGWKAKLPGARRG